MGVVEGTRDHFQKDKTMNCELCGKTCEEFGDVGGAIVCAKCCGWYDAAPPAAEYAEFVRLDRENAGGTVGDPTPPLPIKPHPPAF